MQLLKDCMWLTEGETDSVAYNKKGKQWALSNFTDAISELAALEWAKMQLNTRKN